MTCTNNNVESYQRHLTADEVIRSAICSVEKREMEKLHINYMQSQSSLLRQPGYCPRYTATQFAIPFRPPQVPVDYRSKHHPHNADYCQPPARLCDTQQNRTHSPAYCPRYTATQPTVHHRPQMPVDIETLPPPSYSDCSQPPVRVCDMQQHDTTHSSTQPTPDEHFSLQLSPPLTLAFPTNYNSVKSYMDSQWGEKSFHTEVNQPQRGAETLHTDVHPPQRGAETFHADIDPAHHRDQREIHGVLSRLQEMTESLSDQVESP